MVSFFEERAKNMAAAQNVITDPKSVLNMAITVTVSTQKPPAPHGYISICRKKLLQNLEITAGTRVNAWVDSMRASSPTHIKSTPSLADDQGSWNLHHPSALDMFEQIMDASKGKQIVMFLDYDGTLSPIVEDPDRAFMSKKMRKTVRKLAKCFPTAIVSGRCRDKVYKFVKLAELYYAGSHGMDIKGPEKRSKSNKLIADMTNLGYNHVRRQKVDARLDDIKESAVANKAFLDGHVSSMEGITTDAKRKWQAFATQAENDAKDIADYSAAKHCRIEELLQHCVSTAESALEHYKNTQESVNGKGSKHVLDMASLIRNATNANEQHGAEIDSARIVAEQDGLKNTDDTLQFIDRMSEQDTESVLFQPASEFLPMIDEVYKQLVDTTKSTPGAKVENNKFCVSVHFRCVDEKKWSELAQQVRSVLKDYPKLRLTQGRKVLEIRPTIKWDKGKALEFLLESLGYANCTDVFPVYIGDDRTDEDAFKILRDRGQGFGILVSKFPKETSASYSLQEPNEVMDFLRRLVEWKQLSLRSQSKM